jgi:hypothetical protein
MKIFNIILMIGLALISSQCAYNKIENIPIPSPSVKTDLGNPFPLEAGLLITNQTREQVFQSQSIPDIINDYFGNPLEPYQLPVGQAFEEACVQVFSRLFQKIHLIRTLEEGKNYPVVIEPKLLDFDFHLSYSTFLMRRFQVRIDARSQAKIICTLKIRNRPIWQDSVKTKPMYQRWFDEYQLRNNVGIQASETILKALEELAVKLAEESRKPQAVRGWLEEINPEAHGPAK